MREEKHTFQHKDSVLNYLLYLPDTIEPNSQPDSSYPFILFLHGVGERGDSLRELNRLKIYGIPRLAENQPDFPFIFAAPQCPSTTYWPYLAQDLRRLIDTISEDLPIDPERLYVTGLSMGGYGAWHMAINFHNDLAAVAPVCGGYIPGSDRMPPNICSLKDLPIWAFHGAKDPVVLPQQSIILVEALKRCGGNVRFTLYPDAEHDSWTPTYSNPELYQWFLSHRRRNGPG